MCSLVNNLVDQLRAVDSNISADIMEAISKQVLQKYPCLEKRDDDGFGNGLSYITLKQKMINRNVYLNRLNETSKKSIPVFQKHRNRRAGTVQEYWKTSSDHCPKEVFSKLRRDEPSLLTEEFLEQSQAFVRSRLDQNKNLNLILSELPVLRRRKLLEFHFKKSTGIDIGMLSTYFTAKREKIIGYSTTRKMLKLQSSSTDYEVFDFIAKLVGEDLSDLVLKKEIGTGIDDVHEESAGPVIICIDTGNGTWMFYVFADHTRITEGTTDVIGAIQDLMCVQYVHSFMYLKSAAKFLELVQEYFLKLFPTKGSKSNATRVGKQQRIVQKIIASLSDFGDD
ncbi:uncharacterized protein LOC131678342 [Topomyia yanbarensis]|uniref:uncharacterized protein LOC131678342 n=1 Tax=Topomyia yanbarensis TaxID=2498891 RepID=UPI00273C6680|nr:uncharacterized protein LOC131678342 [Topomyia yanbarensis]